MKQFTSQGGLNVIADFTQNGPFYKEGSTSFYAKSNEIKEMYSDWDVLHYEEKEVPTKVGSTQMAAFVVAKKP